MFLPRIIPVLLLQDSGLVKSIKFKNHRYIGDPINAVKIFNDQEADELVFLDIDASKNNRLISPDFVKNVGDEANMPFAVGGGIKKIDDIRILLENGAEKVVIGKSIYEDFKLIEDAAKTYGSSTITACLDVKNNFLRKNQIVYENGRKKFFGEIKDVAKKIEDYGAGEIIVQCVERDGTYQGYNINIIKIISQSVSIPIVALGGARNLSDFKSAIRDGYASAVAAGSLFVYHGPNNAILINFPSKDEVKRAFI